MSMIKIRHLQLKIFKSGFIGKGTIRVNGVVSNSSEAMNANNLFGHVLVKIFLRLLVKSLVKFKNLSKHKACP